MEAVHPLILRQMIPIALAPAEENNPDPEFILKHDPHLQEGLRKQPAAEAAPVKKSRRHTI
jgi:hypothetical protein